MQTHISPEGIELLMELLSIFKDFLISRHEVHDRNRFERKWLFIAYNGVENVILGADKIGDYQDRLDEIFNKISRHY
jgi:hypothetical protein